jgi:hypothetical protein
MDRSTTKTVRLYRIRCDDCQREWTTCPEEQWYDELVAAASVGWNCLSVPDGGDCLCPECRTDTDNR